MFKYVLAPVLVTFTLAAWYVGITLGVRTYQGYDPARLVHYKLHAIATVNNESPGLYRAVSSSAHNLWHILHEDEAKSPTTFITRAETSQTRIPSTPLPALKHSVAQANTVQNNPPAQKSKSTLRKKAQKTPATKTETQTPVNYDERRHRKKLTLSGVVAISRLDRALVSRFQLSRFIARQRNPPDSQAREQAPIVNKGAQRSPIIYDYPNNFSYSSHGYHPSITKSDVYSAYAKKRREFSKALQQPRLVSPSTLNSQLQTLKQYEDQIFALRMNLVEQNSDHRPLAKIIRREQFDDDGKYEIILIHWQPGTFGFHQLAAIYLPLHEEAHANYPIAVHPMGCGSYLGRNQKKCKLHSRMASLAANGVASATMTGFCSNPPFSKRHDIGYARQHDGLNYIASSSLNNSDVTIYSYTKFIEYLRSRFPIDKNNLATLGYSNGAVFANKLAQPLNAKYIVHVATGLNSPQDFATRHLLATREYNYIFGRNDGVVPIGRVLSQLRGIESFAEQTGLRFVKTVNIVKGPHNFDAERSKIAVEWLLKKYGNYKGHYKDRANTFNFAPPKELKDEMFREDFHHMFSKAAVASKSRYGVDFSKITRDEYTTVLRALVKEDTPFGTPTDKQRPHSFLLNSTSFSHKGRVYFYESWLVNFLDGLDTVIVTLEPLNPPLDQERETVLLLNRDDFFTPLERVEKHLEAGKKLILHEAFGYGHTTDSQYPLGVLNGRLGKTGHTLIGMNIRILDLLALQHGPFNLIETSTLEMNISALLYALFRDYTGPLKEHNTLVNFDDFLSSPLQPVVPPYLFIRGSYLKLDFEKIRRLISGTSPSDIISIDPLVDYVASQ